VLSASTVETISDLILLTAGHHPSESDQLGRILCDADLEVLARPEPAYQRYAHAIYQEYAHLPRHVLAQGRSKILSSLLANVSIYGTVAGRERWEAAARTNLGRELEHLQSWMR